MANILGPSGFAHVGNVEGVPTNFAQSRKAIAPTNTTPIFFGDPVTQTNGVITQSTPGTTQIDGIFVGCEYLSVSQGRWVWSRFWPGADANALAGNVVAWVIDTPTARFQAQANGQLLPAHVGKNVNFAIGTGNTATAMSGASIDITTVATTNTLPFRILSLVTVPPGANGTDQTSPYGLAIVTFNNQDLRSLTGQ